MDGWGSATIGAGGCNGGNTVEDNNAGARGNDECGDGGGNTKDVGSSDCDSVPTLGTRNAEGMNSVSNAGSSLSAKPSPEDDRLETRIFRPAPALPTTTSGLEGDFRGDLCGGDLRKTAVGY
jgi:hypothetical protein